MDALVAVSVAGLTTYEHRTFFEVGYFVDGVWCSNEKAFDYEEALEKQARLAYSHQRDWAVVQVDIKTTRKKM